jgi:hypothetical protein
MAKRSASSAVIEALEPICADNFDHAVNATKIKVALMKASSSDQITFIVQGGWAKFPGNNSSNNPAVAVRPIDRRRNHGCCGSGATVRLEEAF